MENWCYDYPTLMSFAKHYESGEPLPKDMFEKLKAARYARMPYCVQLSDKHASCCLAAKIDLLLPIHLTLKAMWSLR